MQVLKGIVHRSLERMEQLAESKPKPKPETKILQVVPADAGPDIQPVRQKRPMTEAQLAALKRGRERLAEKRKAQHEEEVTSIAPSSVTDSSIVSDSTTTVTESTTSTTESLTEPSQTEQVSTQTDDQPTDDNDDTDDVDESETFAYCVVM